MFSALEVEQRQVNRDPAPIHTDEADVLAVVEHRWVSVVKSGHLRGRNSRATPSRTSKPQGAMVSEPLVAEQWGRKLRRVIGRQGDIFRRSCTWAPGWQVCECFSIPGVKCGLVS